MRQRSAPGIVKRSVLGRVAAQQIVGEGLLLHRLRLLRKSPSTQALDAPGRIIGVHMEVTLSSSHSQGLWSATILPGIPTPSRPMKSSAALMLSAPLQNPCGTNPLPMMPVKVGAAPKCSGQIQNPCGQHPIPLVSAFQNRVATTTVSGGPVLTNGSNRSLRSLGRAKARPLTKR